MAKDRTNIPSDIAARVLFRSDRICCVCRERGRPVQLHHVDENPTNHAEENLAVLCFDCHRDTQIRGGFDRKLDAHQITLYREDWYAAVDRRRKAPLQIEKESRGGEKHEVAQGRGSSETAYIDSLPAQRAAAYGEAQKGWDSGVTADTMNASYALIRTLHSFLVALASFYPPEHFGSQGADEYFTNVITSRFEWHRRHLEPDGDGTGGTIVGTIASGAVISDLETMIVDTVRSLRQDDVAFNFHAWRQAWQESA